MFLSRSVSGGRTRERIRIAIRESIIKLSERGRTLFRLHFQLFAGETVCQYRSPILSITALVQLPILLFPLFFSTSISIFVCIYSGTFLPHPLFLRVLSLFTSHRYRYFGITSSTMIISPANAFSPSFVHSFPHLGT